jgi:hypothetical protein
MCRREAYRRETHGEGSVAVMTDDVGYWVRVLDCLNRYQPDSLGMLEAYEETSFGIDTPRIRMSDGGVVYGFECFWTPVEARRRGDAL